ncbi:uncharacterized protein DNG_08865 [Cephalotrichum gorgonifer]|uniref:Peptidase A2 domain-containing protein n=1 Tax=Cephalotrichum gorgonifer TaxID=2041049 RepID=A0AAE8N4D8_9PEZI|nr:uncharacterized protein DNG_08865 [Cephalotrichum gorgonifer]
MGHSIFSLFTPRMILPATKRKSMTSGNKKFPPPEHAWKFPADDGWTEEQIKFQLDGEEEDRREVLARYADLPPLPPAVPTPEYLVQGAPVYSRGPESAGFYSACAEGRINDVRDFIESSKPPPADLQYGLEQASHGFQAEIVRYLMREQSVSLHTRVFQRRNYTRILPLKDRPPPSLQNIFTSRRPELLDLLKALIDNGWHPNQTLQPLQEVIYARHRSVHEVALHYPRCLQDAAILKLLLDSGADPTIARIQAPIYFFGDWPWEAPVQRKSGEILDLAVKVGTPETVETLLSHGAKLEYGAPLHNLVLRPPPADALGPIPDSPVDPAARFAVAEYLLSLGEDINGVKDVVNAVRDTSEMHLPGGWEATPLSHAVYSGDFAFIEWLLEKGADPETERSKWNRDRDQSRAPIKPMTPAASALAFPTNSRNPRRLAILSGYNMETAPSAA